MAEHRLAAKLFGAVSNWSPGCQPAPKTQTSYKQSCLWLLPSSSFAVPSPRTFTQCVAKSQDLLLLWAEQGYKTRWHGRGWSKIWVGVTSQFAGQRHTSQTENFGLLQADIIYSYTKKKITSLEVSQWHGVSNDKHSHSNGRGDEYNATETFTTISSSSAQLWFKARAGRTLQTKICLCGHARTKCVPSLQAGGHWYRAGELLESCGRWSELAPRLQREQCWCLPAYLVSVRVMDVIRGVGRCCRGVSFPLD